MTRQEKYNRKNRELINAKAKAKAKELRSTPEGKIKADLYAKEKQARYRQRKLLKDVEQFKLRVFKLRPNIEKMTRNELITYHYNWEYKTFHSYNKYWLYEDSDFVLPLREVKMMRMLLEQMIDSQFEKQKKSQVTKIKEDEIKQDEIKQDFKSYPDPTIINSDPQSFIKGFDGLEKFYRLFVNVEDDFRYGSILLAQERRVDSNGDRIPGWMKFKRLENYKHSRYVSLQDANFKVVRIKWSDIFKNYEDENGKITFNIYENRMECYNRELKNPAKYRTTTETVNHYIEMLKRDYNPDGTSKIVQQVELLIAEQEKQLGRKLSINEEMRIEMDYQFKSMGYN